MAEIRNSTQSAPPPIPSRDRTTPVGGIVSSLLKAPAKVADVIALQQKDLPAVAASLLAVAVVCHAIFGLALGLFAGWSVAVMDVLKAPLVAVCSLLLCFPSLYVFACVA